MHFGALAVLLFAVRQRLACFPSAAQMGNKPYATAHMQHLDQIPCAAHENRPSRRTQSDIRNVC